MKLLAYALRSDFAGTTTIERDGEPVEVPTFSGGVLAVGGADFHVRDTLDANDGVLVAYQSDRELVDLLDAYPALKSVPVPEGARPLSPYARRDPETLQHLASLRDFERYSGLRKEVLAARLEAHDIALADEPELVPGIVAGDPYSITSALKRVDPAAVVGDESSGPDDSLVISEVDHFSTDQLDAVLGGGADIEGRDDADELRHVEVPAALEALRNRAREGDQEAADALAARDLTIDQEG